MIFADAKMVDGRLVVRIDLKGDLPGHEFRGNQWSGGGGQEGGAGRQRVAAIENAIRDDSVEHLFCFDKDGKITFTAEGGADNVGMPVALLDGGSLKGATITHNHPSSINADGSVLEGGTFSPDDVSLGIWAGAREIRAVGADATHVIEFGDQAPSKAEGERVAARYAKMLYAEQRSAMDLVMGRHMMKEITYDEALSTLQKGYREVQHEVLTRLAAEVGFKYTRETRK